MPKWHALTKSDYANAGYAKYGDYKHAQTDAVAPLLMAELSHALPYYAIGFVAIPGQESESQRYQLVLIQALQPGLNLYVNQEGKWLAPYVPSYYRSYPFRLIANAAKDNELTLCFDQESGLIHQPAEQSDVRFFDDAGELSQPMKAVVDFLQQRVQNEALTQSLVNQLSDAGLVETWNIEVKSAQDDDKTQPVQGIFRINEQALKQLEPGLLAELAQSGALGLAYAQLLSQARLKDLSLRYQYHAKQQAQPEPLEVDLDKLFGEDDETLKF